MAKEKEIMISISDLKEYLTKNELVLIKGNIRWFNTIDNNDLIAIISHYAKTKVDFLKSYLLLCDTNQHSGIDELHEYIEILKGNTDFNAEFVFSKEDCIQNIKWATETISHIKHKESEQYRREEQQRDRERQREEKQKREKEKSEKIGFIYLIYDGEHIKIGQTKYLSQRLSSIAIEIKKDITLLHSSEVFGYELREKELHNIFKNKNVRGEWFALNDNDIEVAKQYLKEYESNKLQKQH